MAGSGKELVVQGKLSTKRNRVYTSLYTEEIADEIIDRMSRGEPVTRIVEFDLNDQPREPGTFPSYMTVYDWADPSYPEQHKPAYALRFARARLAQHRHWVESTVQIAATPEPGIEEVVEHSAKFGVSIRRAKKDMLHHRALRIETQLKAAARMNPQLWSERLQQAEAALKAEKDAVDEPNVLIIEGGLPDDLPPSPPPGSEPKEPEE